MKKMVTFLEWEPRRNFNNDTFECRVKFSVIDSQLIGAPKERPSFHNIIVIITEELLDNWQIPGALTSRITEEMIKVSLQSLEEHLSDLLKKKISIKRNLPPLFLRTKNSPDQCPYKIENITYPDKNSFIVEIGEINGNLELRDISSIHANIKVLLNRMEDDLKREDYAGVLHTSASIFETLGKEIVGISSIQNQTLGSFFEKYRKESRLPEPILDYIQNIYNRRNITPLAGHGSTKSPNISKEEAIILSEMTKAFVKIEYQLRKKNTNS